MNYFRQSINISIKSLSEIYRQNLIATLLSGANFDCALGSTHIEEKNGTTIVLLPTETKVKSIPQQTINLFDVDHILNT